MTVHYADESVQLHHGDCLDVLRELPDASVDSVVCDPPYGLGFMGREWDRPGSAARGSKTDEALAVNPYSRSRAEYGGASYGGDQAAQMRVFQQWCEQWTAECLRVLKPGGHLLAFGGSRTWHRLACAVEDAGFEVRDSIAWLYGSGFPKSLDVSKAIDKAAGATREVVGEKVRPDGRTALAAAPGAGSRQPGWERAWRDDPNAVAANASITAPATPAAQQWQGWGTALKPAFEPIVVGRKPLAGTVTANVLAHGTGALNIDGCRVAGEPVVTFDRIAGDRSREDWRTGTVENQGVVDRGRWPTNVVLDDSQAAELDRQSGVQRDGVAVNRNRPAERSAYEASSYEIRLGPGEDKGYGGQGGASRFFPVFRYQAKAPTRERPSYVREDGAEAWAKAGIRKRCTKCGRQEVNVPGSMCVCPEPDFQPDPSMRGKVAHPTVKPLALMQWLIRLVTPPGGVVLEPFAGSGTTVEACLLEGFRCIAIEREADYLPLIEARIARAISSPATDEDAPPTLFDATA